MANNNAFRIVISGAVLDKKAYQDIVRDLKKFGEVAKIPIGIDDKHLKKSLKDMSYIVDASGNITKNVQSYNVGLGKTLTITSKLNKETKQLEIASTKVTENQRKATSELDKASKEAEKKNKQFFESYTNHANKSAQQSASAFKQAFKEIEYAQKQAFEKNRQFSSWFIPQLSGTSAKDSASAFEQSNKELFNTRNQQFDSWFSPSLNKGKNQINETTSAFNDLFTKAEKSRVGLTNVEKKVLDLNPALQTAKKNTLSFGESISIALERTMQWATAMTIFYGSLRQLEFGIAYLIQLDSALNQIRIVTGKSQEEVNTLAKSYNNLAKEMSVTTTEIAKAAVEFYRQGLAQNEVNDRLKDTIKYAKISALGFEESAQIITATANSMQLETGRIIDVFAYLGDATATGADEIGKAFQKVGGTAGALNLEFEKVSSWIAVISSRTRESSERIGNSIKSILARLQSLKEKGFAESEDGNLTSVNQVSEALAKANVDLMDKQSGQFRDFGTVIDELGAKWETLDKNTQAYISTTLAGTYQQSRFLTLMEGYTESVKLYEESLNSAGVANEKFSIWQESATSKIEKFKATLEGLWQNTLDSGLIKAIIELGTALVDLIDKIGLVTFAVLGLNLALAGMGKMSKINESIFLLINSLKSFQITTITTTGIINGLKIAFATLWPFLATAVIYGAVKAFDALYISENEQKEIVSTLTTEFEKLKTEIEKFREIENPTEQQKEYLKLLERELQIKEDLLDIEKQKEVKKTVFGEGVFGGGLKETTEQQLRRLEELKYQEKRAEQKLKSNPNNESAIQTLKNIKEGYKEIELTFIENKKIVDDYMNSLGNNAPKELTDKLKIFSDELKNNITDVQNLTVDIEDNTQSQKENADAIKQTSDTSTELASEATVYTKQLQKITTIIDDVNKAMKEYNDTGKLSASTIVDLISKYPQLIDQLKIQNGQVVLNKDAILNLAQIEMDTYIKKLEAEKNFTSAQAIEINKRINKLADEAMAYEKAVEAQRTAMSKMFPGENWTFGGNNPYDAERNKLLGQLQNDVDIQTQIDAIRALAKQARGEGAGAGGSKSSSSSSKEQYKALEDRYLSLNNAIQQTNNSLEANKILIETTDDEQKKIELLKQQEELYIRQQQNVHALADAYRVEREELSKTLAKEGFKFAGEGDNLVITNLENIKGKSKEVEESFKRFFDLQTKEIPSLGKQWRQYEKDIKDVAKTLNDIVSNVLEKQKSAYLEGLNKEEKSVIDSIKNEIEEVNEFYDKQIKKQEKKLKALDEEIEKQDRILKLKELQDEIDKVKSDKRFEFITEQGDRILTYDTAKVADLEQERADLEREWANEDAKQAIQDKIDSLQEAKEEEIKLLEDELETKEIYYNKLIEKDTEKWDSLITSAQEGTLNFSTLMDNWYKDVLKKLEDFGENVSKQTAKIESAFSFGGNSEGNTVKAGSDGKAPKGKKAGTVVETNDGDYLITDVKDDGTYESIKLPKYHDGGIVGGSGSKITELVNKLANTRPNEQLAKLLNRELLIPENNLIRNFIPNLKMATQTPSNTTQFNIQEVNVKANNPKEFVDALRHQLIVT